MTKQIVGPLRPHEKSAGLVTVWGVLALLAWFFHLVGFVIVAVFLLLAVKQFLIEYEVYRIVEGTPDAGYEQPTIPGIQPGPDSGTGTSVGANGERSL